MAGNGTVPGRSVISKISAIMFALSGGGEQTLTQIAQRSQLPLSTTHRLVTELAAWGLLERDQEGCYRSGLPLQTAQEEPGLQHSRGIRERFRHCVAPIMEDLFRATGARVRTGMFDGLDVAYIEKTTAHQPVSKFSSAARLPVHASALGKVLLAFAPPHTIAAIVNSGLKRHTPETITTPQQLMWILREIRSSRMAVCNRELDHHSYALASPVFGGGGGVVAAIELAVSGLPEDVASAKALLKVAAGALARELPREATSSSHIEPHTRHPLLGRERSPVFALSSG